MELFTKIIAHDSDMVSYGTDITEHFAGWESMKESIMKMLPVYDNTKITVKDQAITVHSSGNAAWFQK